MLHYTGIYLCKSLKIQTSLKQHQELGPYKYLKIYYDTLSKTIATLFGYRWRQKYNMVYALSMMIDDTLERSGQNKISVKIPIFIQ